MRLLRAFLLGMREFRGIITTGYYDKRGNALDEQDWYDCGRDLMHRITLRKFEVV